MKRSYSLSLLSLLLLVSALALFGCDAKVESISLTVTHIDMEPGDREAIYYTLSPKNAVDNNIKWTSTDYTVANVVDGVVYAVSEGNATVRATTSNGLSASCSVNVSSPSAYSRLNEDEKKFVDYLLAHIAEFKNPNTVSVINVDYSGDHFIAAIKAMNGFGGITTSFFIIRHNGISETKMKSITRSGYQFNVASINAAIQEYIKEKGW